MAYYGGSGSNFGSGSTSIPMGNNPGASGSGGGGGFSARVTDSSSLLETQNEDSLDQLRGKVSVIKNITLQMQNDIDHQTRFLDTMDTDFGKLQTRLKKGIELVGTIFKRMSTMSLAICGVIALLFIWFVVLR